MYWNRIGLVFTPLAIGLVGRIREFVVPPGDRLIFADAPPIFAPELAGLENFTAEALLGTDTFRLAAAFDSVV